MPNPINDAERYGVRVVEANVATGAEYWKVIKVHHLLPEENDGKHHIYLDALDAAGSRLFGTRLLVSWEGGSHEVVIDKPTGEPGANEPMWKWQVCRVEALGMASDRVENLRSDHPDEAAGNTLFHHSFEVVFQRATAGGIAPPSRSVLSGRVPGGAGRTLVLLSGGQEKARTQAAADESYRFENLAAGEYSVRDESTARVVGPVTLTGENSAMLDFPAAPQPLQKPLARYLLFGPSSQPLARLHLSLLADTLAAQKLAFGGDAIAAAEAARVTLVGEHPAAIRAGLEAAGCHVDTLPADPSALLAAVEA